MRCILFLCLFLALFYLIQTDSESHPGQCPANRVFCPLIRCNSSTTQEELCGENGKHPPCCKNDGDCKKHQKCCPLPCKCHPTYQCTDVTKTTTTIN